MFGRRFTPRKPAPRYHRPSVRQLENRLVPSGISWTGGAATLNWGDAANWSSNTVPTSADDVTINIGVSGTINIGASAYSVRTINDSSASLAIASGGSLSLAAVPAGSSFGHNITVSALATLNVGAGATVTLQPGVTLVDDGTVTFATGDGVSLNSTNSPEQITVGNNGLLSATGTAFYNSGYGDNNQFYVGSGGHLQASNCTFSLNNLYLDNGSILNAGDLVGNGFDLPIYVPYIDMPNLANNLRFQDINILAGTVPSGQTLALNLIGTASTVNLRYVLPSGFIIASGGTMTVAPNVILRIQPGQTLTDNGTVTFANGDGVNFSSTNSAENINVGNNALLTATGTAFYNTGYGDNNQLYVGSGGHLQASNCTFSLNNLYLDNGSILNAGDLVGNGFDLPIYVPYTDMPNLANNLRFQDINILAGTVPSGQTLALNLIGTATTANLRYVFPGSFTIASGGTMAVAPNISMLLPPNQNLNDSGTVSFGNADAVNFNSTNTGEHINVAGSALLTAIGTGFYNSGYGDNNSVYVASGGHLQATSCGFSVNNLYLDNGSVLNSGDLVGNAFDLPIYVPYTAMPNLANNLRFQDINILAGTVPSGQTLALNLIGTASTVNLRYVFPGSFTIASGGTMAVAPNISMLLPPNQNLNDSGTVSFGNADAVNFNSTNTGEHINVGNNALLTAIGTGFYDSGYGDNNSVYVAPGGHLQATNCGFSLNSFYLDNGSVLNSGDLVGNAFDLPIYVPYTAMPNLANNLRFQDINILAGTVPSGQTLALNLIGTTTTANLRYVFPNGFSVASGGTMTVASNIIILLPPNQNLNDSGTVTFANGDQVNFSSTNTAEHINVYNPGVLIATGTSFYNSGYGDNNQLYVGGGGSLSANYCYVYLNSLYADNNSTDTLSGNSIYGVFTINSGAAYAIANNDFSNLGSQALQAVGDPNAFINLPNNYWGTTVASQIAAKILDHNTNPSTRPTVIYSPYLTSLATNQPPVLGAIPNQAVNEGSVDTFTASATDADGDTITYSLAPGAPAGATIDATTGVFSYTPPDGAAVYTITVRATDSGTPSLTALQSFTITVNNVAPAASLTGPLDGFQGVRGQVRAFTVGATDPSPVDQAAGFTYDLHWGDGTPDTIVSGLNGTQVSHIFTAAGSYTITATAKDKDGAVSAAASVTDTINVVEVQNGTLLVGGTPANDTFDLTPGTGDTIAVSVNGTALGTFTTTGQAQVIGEGGSGDVLNLDDQANTLADQYWITASSVGRTNAATISYLGIGTVNVKAGTSANTINVQSTAAGTPVNITMGNGANIINVGSSTNVLDPVQGPVSVTGGTGSNTLNINDQGSPASQTYAIAATTINRSGAAGIAYSKMKQLAVRASSGTDVINIVNTASTTPVSVIGGGGLTTLIGPNVTSTWTLTGANTGTVGNVTFSNIANLQGGSGTDTFKFNAAGSVSGTINGGGGSNKLDYSTYGGSVTVNLQTGASTVTGGIVNIASVTGSTSIANQLIGPNTPNTWSITGPNTGKVNTFAFTNFSNLTGGSDTDAFKFSNGKFVSGVVDGGGGGDWLDYSAYTTSIAVNLATGSATGVNGGVVNIQNVRAGSGGSMLTGNAQGNILVGGIGSDTITGGSGRSLLIGDKGSDTITGGSDDDIVIGDYTTFDGNNAALMSILAEWQRTDLTFNQRLSDLKTGGGLNGTNLLIFGTTVKDDGSADLLTGGAGMDWFFKGTNDTITDLQNGEQVN